MYSNSGSGSSKKWNHNITLLTSSNHPFPLQATWQTLPSYMEESCRLGATSEEQPVTVTQPLVGGGGDSEVRKMSTSSGSATSPEIMDTISPT